MAEIVLTNVTKRWGQFFAVDDLNMAIEDNAFVTLLGPSGCGKTTTLRMIAGLETPTSGRIVINGVPVFDSELGINVPANLRRVGFLFQNYALWPNMTVYQNISFGLSNIKEEMPTVMKDGTVRKTVRKLTREEIDQIVQRVSRIVKIGMFLDRYPSELSGGQQQRVAIARTLAPNPEVLLMDEPLSNLDAKLRLEMRSELQRLHHETGRTFVYVTHDQMEAMTLATRICLMDNGLLQQYDEPLSIYNKPENLFVADFVGNPAINFIEAAGQQESGGDVALNMWDGVKAVFKPTLPVDITKWDMDAAARDRQEQEQRAAARGNVEKGNKDTVFKYQIARVDEHQNEEPAEPTNNDFVIGIRPEFIDIGEDGQLPGEVFSAMPTGMETTVRVRIGNFLLTGVVFGGVLYKIDQKVKLNFRGDDIMLFSRRNGRLIARGALKVM